MQQTSVELSFEAMLAAERPRLVGLCARLSGSKDAAEDLAQETLLAAWRHADRLYSAEECGPWLSGIARNVCLSWARRHYREQARLVTPHEANETMDDPLDTLKADFDLEVELEREELATLLDRALALLPADTRQALVGHYIEESPYAEIAARLGMSEGAVAVRLHRGKLALRRVLNTDLRESATGYSIGTNTSSWEKTRIWCPHCGEGYLLVRFQREPGGGHFMLRCSLCDPEEEMISVAADLSIPTFAAAFENARAVKPAYLRYGAVVNSYFRQVLANGSASCLVCGQECDVLKGRCIDTLPSLPGRKDEYEVRVQCRACGWTANTSLSGYIMAQPEVQKFWRAHPRLSSRPPVREIEVDGAPGLVKRVQSVTGHEKIDVVVLRENFQVIQIHTNSGT